MSGTCIAASPRVLARAIRPETFRIQETEYLTGTARAGYRQICRTTGNRDIVVDSHWHWPTGRPWVPTGRPTVKRPSSRFTDLIITVTPLASRNLVNPSVIHRRNQIKSQIDSNNSPILLFHSIKSYSNSILPLHHEVPGCWMSDRAKEVEKFWTKVQ